MTTYTQQLQRLRIISSFYRNQLQFAVSFEDYKDRLGPNFDERCKLIENGIDPTQKELIGIMKDHDLPLKCRLTEIVIRIRALSVQVGEAGKQEGVQGVVAKQNWLLARICADIEQMEEDLMLIEK